MLSVLHSADSAWALYRLRATRALPEQPRCWSTRPEPGLDGPAPRLSGRAAGWTPPRYPGIEWRSSSLALGE